MNEYHEDDYWNEKIDNHIENMVDDLISENISPEVGKLRADNNNHTFQRSSSYGRNK